MQSETKNPPTITLLGDEDRASLLVAKALQLYDSGAVGAYVEDDSIITVSGNNVTIETTHHAPMSIFSPLDTPGGSAGQYDLWLLGSSHRKDAMLTAARYGIVPSTYAAQFPADIGPELIYMTDGVVFVGHGAAEETTSAIRTFTQFIAMLGIAGVTEDNMGEGSMTAVGPSRIENALVELSCAGSEQQQGDNLYSACCYGVDRTTDPTKPRYRFVVGCSLHVDAVEKTASWYWDDSGTIRTGQAHYYDIENAFVYLTAQEGAEPTAYYYSLGYDIAVKDMDGNLSIAPGFTTEWYGGSGFEFNGCFPVVIPLGNQRVFIIYRKKTTNTNKVFGGTFYLYGKVVSTMSMTQTDVSVAALLGKLTADTQTNGWDFCDVGDPSTGGGGGRPVYDHDAITMWWIMENMAVRGRSAIPISQDETLMISLEAGWDQHDPPGSANPSPWYQVCYSFTSTGVTKKSTLTAGYNGHDPTRGLALDYFYEFHGSCHGSAQNVYVLFKRFAYISSAWVDQGPLLFTSDDDGTTWDGGQFVTMTNDDDSTGTYYLSANLLYIGPKLDIDGAPTGNDILCIGYGDTSAVTGATEIKNPKLMTSEDSGVTWTASKSGGAGRVYTWLNGYYLYHTSRGLCSVHLTGDAVDGFEPSPYRHLPTYYGTPGKQCRVIDEPGQ